MHIDLINKVRRLADNLIKAGSSEGVGLTRWIVRNVLKTHPLTRTVLLLHSGYIR